MKSELMYISLNYIIHYEAPNHSDSGDGTAAAATTTTGMVVLMVRMMMMMIQDDYVMKMMVSKVNNSIPLNT